eukprot:3578436-Rhodomonas_salina.1
MLCASCSGRLHQTNSASKGPMFSSTTTENDLTTAYLYDKDGNYLGNRIVVMGNTVSPQGGRVGQQHFNPSTGGVESFFVPGTYQMRDGVHGTIDAAHTAWTPLSLSRPFST